MIPFKYCSCFLFTSFLSGIAAAAEIRVSPASSRDAKPLTEAIARASAGDTLVLEPGVYHEHVRVEKPLTIRGLPGAVLDGSAPLNVTWTEAGGDLKNVYVARLKGRPRGLLVDGKFIAELRFDKAQTAGQWHWRTLLREGPPLSGFKEILALWIYHPQEQRLYARFENGARPNDLALTFVPSNEPLLRISKTTTVTVEGLVFANGFQAIAIGDDASGCVIRRCRVTSFESSGIVLTSGASDCVVTECEITRGSFEEWTPSRERNRANYEIWQIHKSVGNSDRNGVVLRRAGTGNRILNNRIERVFDGISLGDHTAESLDKPLPDPAHGRGTEIAHNVIENTRDSGIELGVGCVEVNVHHNVLRRTHGGLRFKLPRIGPIYIHHNRFIDGAPFAIWFSMDSSPAEAYVYHNTIVGGTSEALLVSRDSMQRDFIAPRWHFLNNLVLNDRGFCKPSDTPPLDFFSAHNVSTGPMRPWPKDPAKDRGSRYGVAIAHDENGKPEPGSAAVDAGLDLSRYLKGKPLPGCEPGYFRGPAPDAGADEIQ